MPTTDGWGQKVPYPVLSDAPNIELAFQGAVNALAAIGVMKFANANERSATMTGAFKPVPGMISYLIAEDRWDRYDGDKVWRPMSPGPWKPITFASGYTAGGGSPGYRIINGESQLRGAFQRTNGADLVANVETTFLTLPSEARPTSTRSFVVSANFSTSGGVSRFSARITISSGGVCSFRLPEGMTSSFVYLDGIRIPLD
ncbi:hypothetical protein ACFWM7_01285 [Streptomyces sp. NPDC058375]|uniref:hypothetical protein n=1 Tax=Streptomyces sp. NPDC058375 TaxID=3346467 RepID=UPI003657756E